MTPGDIVMMLNEMGGMRVQATSPSLGAASVRIQGMRGRYTRVLSDGLPLFGDVGGLGLLQIPPMDLGQVEVLKGVASAYHKRGDHMVTLATEHKAVLDSAGGIEVERKLLECGVLRSGEPIVFVSVNADLTRPDANFLRIRRVG
jgi:hypothetical protein